MQEVPEALKRMRTSVKVERSLMPLLERVWKNHRCEPILEEWSAYE
jgi:hypothetical protein